MTQMQPDPASEFSEELEFRTKVYELLSLGFPTEEVERFFDRDIDWTLFNADTLKLMMNGGEIEITAIPKEIFDFLYGVKQEILRESKSATPAKADSKRLHRIQLKLYKKTLDFLVGWVIVSTFSFGILFLILMGVAFLK